MSRGSFTHQKFGTDDPEAGHDFIRGLYADYDLTIRGSESGFRLDVDILQIGAMTLSRVRHTMSVSMFLYDGIDWPGIFTSRLPTLDIEADHHQHRLGPGDAVAGRTNQPYRATWDTVDADTLALDPALLADVAAELTGNHRPVDFDFDTAISPVAAAHWNQTLALVGRVALANAVNLDGALLADQLCRLLSTAALTCFPNTTMADANDQPVRTAPASLRRAVAFIDAHLDQPIRLADLAHAAGVSQRALNLTFNRHHGTSPIGYIRRARLDQAHHDLQDAQPGDGQSVTSIAARWGFHSLPRFGVTYRRTYGQPPSHTLRRG